MGRSDADDESWTDMEPVQPVVVEAVPIRHGMVLGGRYAIEKIIGRGGSGVVVRAHDRDLRAAVAIKIVRAELAGQRIWAERLAREVRLARQIQHPHVCRVFDFQQAEGRAFLVMELAEGGTLRDEIRSGALAARPLAERIADARAVASALAAIHAAGIVHRDLTPQNLLRLGDGRVVVSDFGLATDASESTSVHGGTVAYMAPEVLRGGKSSFASDIWALGVVMHELVFGVKPRWSDAASTEMLAPALGRKLTDAERAAFEACRACTGKAPERRIASAGDAGRLLTERRRWFARHPFVRRRPLTFAVALTATATLAIGVVRTQRESPDARTVSSPESPLIIPTGEPADWTDVSAVIAEVSDRIHCIRLLPDHRTIRFVWGTPKRAEDIDMVTRKRVPSPLVPAAYAEGCPDLSPDGKRVVFQGHDRDARAYAFLSENPNGKNAVPAVPTAEPSMSSEPTWLADGETFSFDVDAKHMGVFSTSARRMTVLPEVTAKPFVSSFRFAIGGMVLVSASSASGEMEFAGFSTPSLKEETRFRLPEFAVDFVSNRSLLYYTNPSPVRRADLIEVNPSLGQARPIGSIRDQSIRYPILVPHAVAFVSIRLAETVFVRHPDGETRPLNVGEGVQSAARCGDDLVVARQRGDRVLIERLDSAGRFIATLTEGPWDANPACSADGRVLSYLQQKGRPVVMRCEEGACRKIADCPGYQLAMSPDGERFAFVAFEKRGPVVYVMDASGSRVREIMETETGCAPGWISNDRLWVSRRRAGRIVWLAIDAESGRETGESRPGLRDCHSGRTDPLSPANRDVRTVADATSQLRLLGQQYLERR